jgi:hypothetical protein
MSDLILREKDGWIEISDLVQQMRPAVQKEFWDSLTHGTKEDTVETLEIEIGDLLQDRIGQQEIKDVTGFIVPLGQAFRIWIKIDVP